jgi:hypothetical protein
MNEKSFQLFLEEKKTNRVTINKFLLMLKAYETYLLKENLDLDNVNPKKLVEYTEYLASINKGDVLDFLVAILNYANYSKKYEFITEAIDIFESYNAMDNLYTRIAEVHSEQIRDEIFNDLVIPPLGVHPEKKPDFTKTIMKRMEDKLGQESLIELLSPCLHGRPPDDIEGDKKLLAELGIDRFLQKKHQDTIKRLEKHRDERTLEFAQRVDDETIEYIKKNQIIGAGKRKGNLIYISKIPYQTKNFLNSKDNRLKKFYLCYCPWVRGALKEGSDEDLSNSFCHCSAGWYKLYWDQIFEQSVKVEPVKSALNNDMECTFTVQIPDNIISKIT